MLKLLKPTDLESVLRSRRSHHNEKPVHSPHSLQPEKARTQLQRPKANKNKQTNLLYSLCIECKMCAYSSMMFKLSNSGIEQPASKTLLTGCVTLRVYYFISVSIYSSQKR